MKSSINRLNFEVWWMLDGRPSLESRSIKEVRQLMRKSSDLMESLLDIKSRSKERSWFGSRSCESSGNNSSQAEKNIMTLKLCIKLGKRRPMRRLSESFSVEEQKEFNLRKSPSFHYDLLLLGFLTLLWSA